MPFANVAGAKLYWKMEGLADRPPVLLINSIGTDLSLWNAVASYLRDDFRVIRMDTRGHGKSSAPTGDYSLSLLAGDVISVMQAAGYGRAAIAGVSLGGMVGMEVALSYPECVAKLVLICTSACVDRSIWAERIEKVRTEGMPSIAGIAIGRFFSPQFNEKCPDVTASVKKSLLKMNPDGYAGCAAAIRDMKLEGRLSGIRSQTLVITGDRDSSMPFSGHGEVLLQQISGARSIHLESAHLAPLEAPRELARAMVTFLI